MSLVWRLSLCPLWARTWSGLRLCPVCPQLGAGVCPFQGQPWGWRAALPCCWHRRQSWGRAAPPFLAPTSSRVSPAGCPGWCSPLVKALADPGLWMSIGCPCGGPGHGGIPGRRRFVCAMATVQETQGLSSHCLEAADGPWRGGEANPARNWGLSCSWPSLTQLAQW